VDYYASYLVDNGYMETVGIVFREVGTSLEVTPRIRGRFIEVSLTPQISYVSDEVTGAIAIQELSTTVLAADGQPVSIGGLIRDREFAGRFFKGKAASHLDITLTPRIR